MRIEVSEEFVPQDFHRGDETVTEVVFMHSVREIGLNAFRECPNLVSVKVSNGVERIGRCAFMMCRHLATLEIEDGLLYIDQDAFWKCERLETVTFPSTLLSIGERAFERCTNLINVDGAEGRYIGTGAFGGSRYEDEQAEIREKIEKAAQLARVVKLDASENVTFPNMANILNHFGFKTRRGEPYREPYGWWHGGYDIGIVDGINIGLWFPHVSYNAGGFANIVSYDGRKITERRALQRNNDKNNPAEDYWRHTAQLLRRGAKVYRATFAYDIGQVDNRNGYRFVGVFRISGIEEGVDGYDFVLTHELVSTHFEYLNGMHLSLNQIIGS